MLAAFGSASGLFGNGQRLLVAGIHETAVMAGRREIWVVDRHPVGLAIEVSEQARVRPELFRTSAELSHVTDHDAYAAVHGADCAAHFDVLVAIAAQVANIVAVCAEAEQGEAALLIGQVGGADIQEAGSIGQFYDVVDVSAYAHVLVDILARLRGSLGDWDTGSAGMLALLRSRRGSALRLRYWW
jgi:hypothetical protein